MGAERIPAGRFLIIRFVPINYSKQWMIVEDPIGAINQGFAVPPVIDGDAEARREVVGVVSGRPFGMPSAFVRRTASPRARRIGANSTS